MAKQECLENQLKFSFIKEKSKKFQFNLKDLFFTTAGLASILSSIKCFHKCWVPPSERQEIMGDLYFYGGSILLGAGIGFLYSQLYRLSYDYESEK